MGKKKRIREEFDAIFKSGDENAIHKMLEKYPWLLEEVSSEMDEDMLEQHQIVAAIGVMEDEIGGPVQIHEIEQILQVDFKTRKTQEKIQEILNEIIHLNLIKKESNGWSLTREGERICDTYLNKNLGDIEL
ncbi:MAG: hypothetical protein ACFFAN_09155 [Promethearchaeota archaeon]